MKRFIINILLILAVPFRVFCQADSIQIYAEMASASSEPQLVLQYAQRLHALATQAHDTSAMIEAYSQMGWAYNYINMDTCVDIYTRQFHLAYDYHDERSQAKALYNIGGMKSLTMQYNECIEYFQQALLKFEKLGEYDIVARIYRDMANNCANMELYASARANIDLAVDIDKKHYDSCGLAYDFAGLSQIYSIEIEGKDHYNSEVDHNLLTAADNACDSILKYLDGKDIDEFDRINIQSNYFRVKTETQLYYAKMNPHDKTRHLDIADENNKKFYHIGLILQDDEYILKSMIQKAEIEFLKGNAKRAIQISDSIKNELNEAWPTLIIKNYKASALYHQSVGDYRQALEDFSLYDKHRQQFMNDKAIMQNAEFRANSQQEVKILQLTEKQNHENAIHEEQSKRQKLVIILVSIMLAIVAVAIVIIGRQLRLKKKTLDIVHQKNVQLSQQQEEILTQRDVIQEQKEKVEKQRQIVMESISYARHIQQAALPSQDTVSSIFPDSFVYYVPKDIVSGDFYYVSQNAGWNIFIMADCTGHGVPGAFLSMLGISALQDVLRDPDKDIMPNEILNKMREHITHSLSNDEDTMVVTINGVEEQFSTADGMDMSIACINTETMQMRFAGAYQGCLIARKGEPLIRLKGDRMPVGRHINAGTPFKSETISLKKGDMIYLASDGIVSQINSQGQKYMTKRLMEFITENHTQPCEVQKQKMTDIMTDWLKDAFQIDDLSLAGIRI